MGPFIERDNPGLLWIQCSRFRNVSNIVYGDLGISCQNEAPGYEKVECSAYRGNSTDVTNIDDDDLIRST